MELRWAPAPGLAAADIASVGSEPELVERIRAEIAERGPISFERFMSRALYEPGLGYYRRPDARPGRAGDFLTAPETHPIFGATISRFVADVWAALGRPSTFTLREHGAGAGTLAVAILDGLAADRPELLEAIRYQPVEVEAARMEAFAERLEAAGHGSRVDLPVAGGGATQVSGLVLANEVLDALPTHRVRQGEHGLEELFVDWDPDGGRFVEVAGPPETALLEAHLRAAGVELRAGQVAEICLAATRWTASAAAEVQRGALLLIDYGHPAAELYGARRMAGSLLAYVGQRVHDEPLINVGRQDLTAHVDLTAVERVAAESGLDRLGVTTQARFLVDLGIEELLRRAQADPTATPEAYLALRSGLMRLLDPRATGGFAVLAFGRGLQPNARLRGFG